MALIRLEDIGLAFAGKDIFKDFNLTLQAGQRLALLGASGVGKSTLLRLIAGLVPPQSGRIYSRVKQIGFVFQDARLLPWLTVYQNLQLVLQAKGMPEGVRAEKISYALAGVKLEASQSLYPHQLSGGMAQRVSLARAFIIEPDLLLLDEPFSALDVKLKQDLGRLLVDYLDRSQAGVVYVSHSPHEVLPLTDTCLVLQPARMEKTFNNNQTEAILAYLKDEGLGPGLVGN
ncbi:MAG: ABC transporter ATP-binding protein [Gammaproteobacteria bacterium]|jgi:NitT/TauT family transport system ATP-binding protein|nr:ABC transporter ATP-binding protein [Gammaproteobacteria bacterium]